MADEIFYSVLADQALQEILSGKYIQLLADRYALPNHPALFYAGDVYGTKTDTVKVPMHGLPGYDEPAQVNVGTAIGNTAWTDDSVTVQVARYGKVYELGDVARFTQGDRLNAMEFVLDAMRGKSLALTSLIAATGAGFTDSVDAGTSATVAEFRTACQTVAEAHAGPGDTGVRALAVLDQVTWHQIQADAGDSLAGALQYSPEMLQAAQRLLGKGYKGQYFDTDVFVLDRVTQSGGDRINVITGYGGIVWNDMDVRAESADEFAIGDKILFGKIRSFREGQLGYGNQFYLGASLGQDAAGLRFLNDV